jgi:hypothetical protein
MSVIQILIIVFAFFAITRTVFQFKKRTLSLGWLLFWTSFWAVTAFVAFLPQTTDAIARLVGVGRGADVVIYLSLIALFYLVFRIYVKIEQVEREVTGLVRKLALNEIEEKD